MHPMGTLRYAIAGHPIAHSLSPLLMHLVHAHVQRNHPLPEPSVELVEASTISDALAWGYAGAVPSPPVWALTNGPFGKFRTSTLLKRAVHAAFEATAETHVEPALSTAAPPAAKNQLPTRQFNEEIWLNLTSPLKHQLHSNAVKALDNAMDTMSVNALRWDGKGWWSAGLDGEGLCDALIHLGWSPNEHVLGILGGGGAARSVAAAWTSAGGRIHPLEGNRPLMDGPWDQGVTTDNPHISVRFDREIDPPTGPRLDAWYEPMDGDVEARLKAVKDAPYNGRWMLVAQHLACWRRLWAPELAQHLPPLEVLMHQLLVAEHTLAGYA